MRGYLFSFCPPFLRDDPTSVSLSIPSLFRSFIKPRGAADPERERKEELNRGRRVVSVSGKGIPGEKNYRPYYGYASRGGETRKSRRGTFSPRIQHSVGGRIPVLRSSSLTRVVLGPQYRRHSPPAHLPPSFLLSFERNWTPPPSLLSAHPTHATCLSAQSKKKGREGIII